MYVYCRGKKIISPEARDKLYFSQGSIYFHPMSDGQVIKYSARLYIIIYMRVYMWIYACAYMYI